jgi:hypothetical protein
MQAKPALLEYNDLPKIIFCFENMFLNGLKHCSKYFEGPRNLFELN